MLKDSVTVRFGKQDLNTEFLNVDLAQDFIKSTWGLPSSPGLPSYLDPSMAAAVLVDLTESMRLKFGFSDALTDTGKWGFSGNAITLLLTEVQYDYALADSELPGMVELGVAYSSGGNALSLTVPPNSRILQFNSCNGSVGNGQR